MNTYFNFEQLKILQLALLFVTFAYSSLIIQSYDFNKRKIFPIILLTSLLGAAYFVSNEFNTRRIAYNLKNYPLGIPGLKEVSLTYQKTEKTLYSEKKQLFFVHENESLIFEVETETIAAMSLSPNQTFKLYYFPKESRRCLYQLTRDWTSVDILLTGSKKYCTKF